MTLDELNRFIANAKRLHQNGIISKDDRIKMLTETNYREGLHLTAQNVAMINEMKTRMDAAIAEARE